MPLYQTSVLKNYLKRQDKETVAKAFKKFSKYFHNTSIQQNIRESKEEQFQEGFLRELFVDILDYTLNPQPNYNLTTELKNEKGAKKADGAILLDGNALGVIELKSTKTKDLESIRQQAFDYKANQTGCVYVITSNFEKLRFYINNAVEFEEFDLFTLTQNQFELLYLCLHKDNLLSNVPLKIKEASVREEEVITKKFYNDYSLFKRELFRDLVKLNMKNEVFRSEFNREDTERANKNIKHNLFKKSQKLIDRFLFIFFAEDRDLLPPNSTLKILEQWNKLKDLDAYAPLYDRFKLYFGYLDTGRKGTDKGAEIFAYNGGLFKPDSILDSLQISDELLFKHTEALSKYDFESQVDVNILGHIFENSLNEIESVNAEIEGVEFDKQKTKRKKDGVFYTPKYITKYIVDNTVGKLCAEKKAELKIIDEEYTKNRKGRTTAKLKELRDQLENYRNWLLQITICDPACGSGAFLNQALDFLIKEHQYIDELQASLLGGGFVFPDIENTVLENNIFGVDLNEESVEIAKLSLWLRTAQPRRKLNDLSSNIKCGNSLIDSKAVAGDKAFKWEDEFPQVFAKGGFDVIIGNPPYVRQELFKEFKPFFKENYKCYNSIADLYTYFIEKGIHLFNEKGCFSFILPNKFIKASYGKEIRRVIKEESQVELLFDFDDFPVFEDATTYPLIFIFTKNVNKKTFIHSEINKRIKSNDPIYELDVRSKSLDKEILNSDKWIFSNIETANIISKMKDNSIRLEELVNGKVLYGLKTGCNKAFIIDENDYKLIGSENLYKVVAGREVKRYNLDFDNKYLIYNDWYFDIESDVKLRDFMLQKKGMLENRAEVKQGKYPWWSLSRYGSNNAKLLFEPKIIYPRINNQCNFYFDEKGEFLMSDNNFYLSTDQKYLVPILNSKLIFYFISRSAPTLQGGFYDFRRDYVIDIPVKEINQEQKTKLSEYTDKMQGNNSNYRRILSKFVNYIESQFSQIILSKKLQNWHELTFAEFIKELSKAIKTSGGTPLTKLQEMEWMEVFETKKAEAQALKSEIDKTDKEIDKMVYELYGLSEEEIAIVENSTK